jgi:hypothetical protein
MPCARRSSSCGVTSVRDLVVVGRRDREELDAAVAHLGHGLDDVARGDREVLGAGALVELEVLLDLGLALALGRLVDGELDDALAVGDDLRHQGGVLGRDVVVGEVDHLLHVEDVLVERHPRVHVLDVADDVVDREEHAGVGRAVRARLVAGQERALVVGARDEGVQRLAVGLDRRQAHGAVLVGGVVGRDDAVGAAGRGLAPRVVDIGDRQRDDLHAVAVGVVVGGDRRVGVQRAGQHEPDAALAQDERCPVAHAGLQAGVGDEREPEGARVEVRGLLGVADEQLHVVHAVERHVVLEAVVGRRGLDRAHDEMICWY